jgi:hypothetical protein
MKTLNIEQTPAVINFNYEDVKASIESELERYDITVTEDTVADAKKLATELNKMAGEIDQRRKEAVKAVSAPIKDADDQMKSLVSLIKNGRQKLLEQVADFDQRQLDDLQKKLMQVMVDERENFGIQPEFRTQSYADLVILSNRTKTGNVARKAVDEIRYRVSLEKNLQSQTERRLLELENHCYRAGLDAPLQRQHVEHFLFADDEQYGLSLEKMMQAELDRQKAASERRERMAEQSRPEPQPEPETKQEQPAEQPKPKQDNIAPGKIGCTVTATFEIQVNPGTEKELIEKKLRENMKKAGITTLASVDIAFQDGNTD